jgi:membrane-associated protease RseP (regulator of RpoE activity)
MADDDATTPDETKADDAATTEPQAASASSDTPKEAKEAKERKSFAVPAWAAGVLAAILLLGVGFAVGWISNDGGGGGHDRMEIGRRFPGGFPGGPQRQRGPQNRVFPPLERRDQENQQNQDNQQASGAFLGVQVDDATGNTHGASVAAVEPGSPADHAGIQEGDIITAVDGNSVSNAAQLAQRISSHSAGDKVTLSITRNGSSHDVDVMLGSQSDSLPNLPGLPGVPNPGSNTQSN